MPIAPRSSPAQRSDEIGTVLRGTFAQPEQQALPTDFLAMLVALDRQKRAGR